MSVYTQFGLKHDPFNVLPASLTSFPTPTHSEAFATLRYAVQTQKSCVVVVGESGSGKTQLARMLLQTLQAARPVLWVHGIGQTGRATRATLIKAGVITKGDRTATTRDQLGKLIGQLATDGRPVLVVLDDADELPEGSWNELLGLLTGDPAVTPALNLVILGTPALRERFQKPELLRLRRRVFRVCLLRSLGLDEVHDYLARRITAAGSELDDVFEPDAVTQLARYSRGNPGLINQIADNAMIEACSEERDRVTVVDIRAAVLAILGINIAAEDVGGLLAASETVSALPGADNEPSAAAMPAESGDDDEITVEATPVASIPMRFGSDFHRRMCSLQDRMRDTLAAIRVAHRTPNAADSSTTAAETEVSAS